MHGTSKLLALAGSVSSAIATFQGFNYGSTFTTGAVKAQSDFEAEFKAAQALINAPGVFNSARLYTTVQGGTTNDPISAIPAAVSTKTTLLLGLWASAGDATFANELQALKSAIATYGDSLGPLVAGISVGSEDLYRISPTGILNKENPGVGPDVLVKYINQVKDLIKGTSLANAPVGHVDTWTAWVNGSNNAVIDAVDWLGVDTYPYFQNTEANGIENGKSLFDAAFDATGGASAGKPVWVTETGWPVSGKDSGAATASLENAKTYWDEVGCSLFGKTNTWWYTLQDAAPDTPNPSFGLVGTDLNGKPVFDLACDAVTSSSSAAATSTSASGSGSGSNTKSGLTTTTVPASKSSAASSAAASATESGSDSGSPGLGSGLASSQVSLETKSVTPTYSSSSAASTGSGSGSSSNSTSGSGTSGSGSSGSGTSGSSTSSSPSASASLTAANTGAGNVASLGAAFAAVFVAMLAL